MVAITCYGSSLVQTRGGSCGFLIEGSNLQRAIRCSHIEQKIAIGASISNIGFSQCQVIIVAYIRLRKMCKPVRAFAARINGT